MFNSYDSVFLKVTNKLLLKKLRDQRPKNSNNEKINVMKIVRKKLYGQSISLLSLLTC